MKITYYLTDELPIKINGSPYFLPEDHQSLEFLQTPEKPFVKQIGASPMGFRYEHLEDLLKWFK